MRDFDGEISYSDAKTVIFQESGMTAYPNPANEKFTAILEGKINTAHVFDYLGKECLLPIQLNDNQVKLDVSQLPNGVYYLKTTLESEQKTIVFVVHH